MTNTNIEALNTKQILNSKFQIPNVYNLIFKISDLSFDFAQDGKLVEPFLISILGFRYWRQI